VKGQGRRITLEAAAPTRAQVDGEVSRLLSDPEALRLQIETRAGALSALLPAR